MWKFKNIKCNKEIITKEKEENEQEKEIDTGFSIQDYYWDLDPKGS